MPKLLSACLAVAAIASTLSLSAHGNGTQAAPCLVTTDRGDVQGRDFATSCAFLGVPYAAPTGGASRWKPPQPRAPWAPAVVNATTASPVCAQVQQPSGTPTGVEDCLFMNIWTRDLTPDEPAPVLVWFHTGGFTNASANFAGTNGRRLAEERGIVVVAPNYRVGSLGFLAHGGLATEDPAHPTSGNYGLLDQQAALRWVRDNVARFGGDPDNVTIGGTSAGGASVGLQLVSPASAGLFHRAIVQSAYPTTRWTTHAEHLAAGDSVAAALGCVDPATVLACMRGKTQNEVLLARPAATQQVIAPAGRIFWEPVVDGLVIPDQPRDLIARGLWSSVPVMVGANRDEGWGNFITRSFPNGVSLEQYENWIADEFGANAAAVLAAYPAADHVSPEEALARLLGDGQFVCEARRLARLISDQSIAVYLYSYEYVIPDLSPGHVNHGFETNIIFGNTYSPPIFPAHVLDAADQALHDAMAGYWTRFVATGVAGGVGDLKWRRYGERVGRRGARRDHMIFDAVVTRGDDLREEACDFWSQFDLRSMLGAVPAGTQD
ncbi:MAG TPA: carboxylesterase family protein [Vicinamibacterales bacterium]|nr:carboxylesterase family protein [Vicinamibacterales bacterium]